MEVIAYGHSFLHPAADRLGIADNPAAFGRRAAAATGHTGGVQAGGGIRQSLLRAAEIHPLAARRHAATAAQAEAKTTPASAPEETPPAQDSKGGLPFGISDHIDAAMQLLSDDPMAFAKCMLGHTGWLGRRLLRTVRVQHLDVFWTVTADEASTTAELYGAEIAALNNLLAFLQQYIRLQSDRLWLEPDFTGERTGERNISFRVSIGTGVLLWLLLRLLWRLWKDPQLQPAAKNS